VVVVVVMVVVVVVVVVVVEAAAAAVMIIPLHSRPLTLNVHVIAQWFYLTVGDTQKLCVTL